MKPHLGSHLRWLVKGRAREYKKKKKKKRLIHTPASPHTRPIHTMLLALSRYERVHGSTGSVASRRGANIRGKFGAAKTVVVRRKIFDPDCSEEVGGGTDWLSLICFQVVLFLFIFFFLRERVGWRLIYVRCYYILLRFQHLNWIVAFSITRFISISFLNIFKALLNF